MKKQTARAWVGRVLRPDAWRVALLALLSALSSCSGVAFALLSRQVLDTATGAAEGSLWLYSAGLIVVLLAQIGLDVLVSRLSVYVTGRVEMRIRDTIFAALFRKRWADIRAYHSGDLMNRLTSDTQVVVNGVVSLLPRAVSLITRLVACAVVLVLMDWRFALIMLVLGGALLFFSRLYGRRMKALHKACQQADGEVRAYMQEGLENWTVIQSFNGSGTVRRRLLERMKTYFTWQLRRNRWGNLSSSLLRLAFSGSYYVALAWGALRLSAGGITYGTLMAFLQIVSQIRMPLVNMSGLLPQYYNMLASAERLLELTQLPDEPRLPQPPQTAALYAELQCIRAAHLDFAYEAGHPVLQDAQITVRRGEFVALVGFSGIGKSTFFKLLLGFCQPQHGTVAAVTAQGETPLGADTRGLFAYVPQENMLLSGTVRDNIAQFAEGASDEAIWQAAETAQVAAVLRGLPQGLDTVLGERGAGLSEGQLQRLAIARAVLSGAPILLLDEATSALDEPTEEQVLRSLRALSDRTCLCISHRPAALAVCDRVIRVGDGRFSEE
mgnify:FL=1